MAELMTLGENVDAALDRTAAALTNGHAVVVPTDTVYGLAALPSVPGAVPAMVALKGRSDQQPTAVLVADAAQVDQLVTELDPRARSLMQAFWPGPLTLVLPNASSIAVELGGDGSTVGVRSPQHTFLLELAARTGPIAATSANLHGQDPVASAQDAQQVFPGAALVIDDGQGGTAASTVVSLVGPQPEILRAGAVTETAIGGIWQIG